MGEIVDSIVGFAGIGITIIGDSVGDSVVSGAVSQYDGGYSVKSQMPDRIQSAYVETFVFTDGTPGTAHPYPNEIMPTCTPSLDSRGLIKIEECIFLVS
jgi:hypothetical protein